MIKTAQTNYFDKTGKKAFTYYYIEDPHFYDDDANACDNWVQAHIPLRSNESPKQAFYRMLLSREVLTARQLREFRREQKEQLPVITIDTQMSAAEKQASQKATTITKKLFGNSVEVYVQRHLRSRERQ